MRYFRAGCLATVVVLAGTVFFDFHYRVRAAAMFVAGSLYALYGLAVAVDLCGEGTKVAGTWGLQEARTGAVGAVLRVASGAVFIVAGTVFTVAGVTTW